MVYFEIEDLPSVSFQVEFVAQFVDLKLAQVDAEFGQDVLELLSRDKSCAVRIHLYKLLPQVFPHVINLSETVKKKVR